MRNLTDFKRPDSLGEAVAMLRTGPGKGAPIAGGTRLVIEKNPAIEYLVDLSRLGLGYIEPRAGGLAIGATATLQQIVESALAQNFAGGLLVQALRQQGTEIIRNAATIGGEIAARFEFSDLIVALLALDARLEIQGQGARTESLADFLAGLPLVGEIIREVVLSGALETAHSAYRRISRTKADQFIVCSAAAIEIENGRCRTAHLAIGGAWPTPRLIREANDILEGKLLSRELVAEVERLVERHADPPSDFRAGAEYRREVAAVLARRALIAAGGLE